MNPRPLVKFTPRQKPPLKSGPLKRDRMTLIVGLKCRDAVIIAAETEESAQFCGGESVCGVVHSAPGPRWRMLGPGFMLDLENEVRIIDDAVTVLRTKLEKECEIDPKVWAKGEDETYYHEDESD